MTASFLAISALAWSAPVTLVFIIRTQPGSRPAGCDLAAAEDLKESVASNFANLKFEDETEDRIRARTQGEWQVLTQP